MHQHPRPPPKTASPASSPTTNPHRTNNPRDDGQTHARINSEAPMYNDADEGGDAGGETAASGPSRETVKKLDQIIQNFHTKAAIVILQSRMSLPIILTKDNNRKVNKWFQLETDDTEAFRDDLRLWKTCGGFENRPPPLILETFLDTSALTSSQSLVIVDDQGKRWDLTEALNNSSGSNDGNTRDRKQRTEIILERWKIELRDLPNENPYDFGAILPTIYKKLIVFFRSLYATTKFVPAWRFARSLAKAGTTNTSLRVNCRIINGSSHHQTNDDGLNLPLYESDSAVVTRFSLGETESPAGRFAAELTYRNDCNFRVDDSESLLSSRFMGADEQFFPPSLGSRDSRQRNMKTMELGSLPSNRQRLDEGEPTQAYGSLSTFHGDAPPRGSSPISALRAAKTMGSDSSMSPVGSFPYARPVQPIRPSSRALDGIAMARRPSVSFHPFKAGSLSASPIPGTPLMHGGEMLSPQSPQSLPRVSGISALAQARNRSSLIAGMPASLRGVPHVPENPITSSASSSPKPTSISRYSSSFSHRRARLSYGGTSRMDDDQGSSGKQSLSSSAQPGSGILAEGPGGSSGSLQPDDDNIADFLKLLDSKKTLQSFEPGAGGTSAKRTSAQLSKFQLMKDSHNALTESMSSSTLLHRSSSSSSRHLSSVPPMIAATSMSTSSSPGKPISPHTPHTPAIPSRLSANSIVDYSQPRRLRERGNPTEEQIEDVSGDDEPPPGTTAIDIPTSPRPYYPHNRRSSSVAQRQRSIADDDVTDLQFGVHRSVSLGADDREPPSLSDLLGQGQSSETAVEDEAQERTLQPAAQIVESPIPMARHGSRSPNPPQQPAILPGSSNTPYRPLIGGGVGRGTTPPPRGSFSPLASGSSSALGERPGGYSFSRPPRLYEPDDEPLLFDMSEIGREQSRRSIEEGRGSADDGGNASERGGDSVSNSQRGSHRGW